MPGHYRTISGAFHQEPNIEHNNRDHIPWNAHSERADNNVIFVNGTKNFTLEQAYDKLFQESYEKWLEKERRKSRAKNAPSTYYEKIEQDKKKHLSYEVIWQIGDMDDTGYDTNPENAKNAEEILWNFAMRLMFDLPNVTFISKNKIEDPDWKPPFDAGIIITNFALNGDESTPHLHMTFVPYSDNCSRGQQTQNALSQTFARMGYKTTMKHAVDKNNELVWQNTQDGKKPQMVRDAFGAIEWIEEQKEWLAEQIEKRMNCERLFKGKNERGDLKLSDYRRERAAEKALEAELELQRTQQVLEVAKVQTAEELEKLDNQITNKKEYLSIQQMLLDDSKESLKELDEEILEKNRKVEIAEDLYREMASNSGNSNLFDMVVDLRYENQTLREKIQQLQAKLQQAYDFMKQIVISGRNLFEMFCEHVGEI
ncbi:MAG: hypothetical protein IKW08_07460 [Roseburia sp.]|nr:hypothetical protein [Roseburia sp.]